jgi:Mg-chelatase subunit ChlD
MGRVAMYFCIHALAQLSTASRPQHPAPNVVSLIQKSVRDIHTGIASLPTDCALDVVMVIDTSGSICDNKGNDCRNWRDQRSAAVHFAEQLAQKPDSKVGVLTFATHTQWHKKLTTDITSVASAIGGLAYATFGPDPDRWTNLKEALDQARDELHANPNPDHRQVVMVFTDGEPTAGGTGKHGHDLPSHESAARMAADKVKAANFQLSMVAIGKADTKYMKSLVTPPVDENFFPVSKFESLTKSFIENMLEEICDSSPSPTPQPVGPPTPQTPAPPTPSPVCEIDTRAECLSIKNLCFQRTRGHTECKESFDGRFTCHCVGENECVRNQSMPMTRDSKWGICRKVLADGVTPDPSDVRGEGNPVTWFFMVSWDIFESYFKILR